jgi:MerR family transcriptional regulator, thiopeptide resistance regulator
MNNAAQTYSVGEFAKLAGVTVRALHFYDEVGLLKPIRQRQNRRRQYRQLDLLRLQQIITLRTLGFSLNEIETLLTHPEYNIAEALKAQKNAVDAQITQLQQVSYALSLTMERLETTQQIDWSQVTSIIRSLTDTDKSDWLKQFYPPEWWAWLRERGVQMPPDAIKAGVDAWQKLYDGFAKVRHLPVDDPQVQALAAEMDHLGSLFTRREPAIEQSLAAMYRDVSQIPEQWRLNSDQSLQDFMVSAVDAYRKTHKKEEHDEL